MQAVLATVADDLGRPSGVGQRARPLSGGTFVQTLVLGWLGDPAARLSDLTHTAAALGWPISPQGLAQRCTAQAATLLAGVVAAASTQVVRADPMAIPRLARLAGVVLGDCTAVALPDALAARWAGTGERTDHNRAALKLYGHLDLLDGQVHGRTCPPPGPAPNWASAPAATAAAAVSAAAFAASARPWSAGPRSPSRSP